MNGVNVNFVVNITRIFSLDIYHEKVTEAKSVHNVHSNRGKPMKLNLGCGSDIREGWTNIDFSDFHVKEGDKFVLADLDEADSLYDFTKDSCDEFLLSHVIEHLKNPLILFESMYRIAKPNALCTIHCPYGSSDDADEDPTHVRRMYIGSFGYFGQPNYWKTNYNYHGDWKCEKITLIVHPQFVTNDTAQFNALLMGRRNVVMEMRAELRAIKPMREAKRELQTQPEIIIAPGRYE